MHKMIKTGLAAGGAVALMLSALPMPAHADIAPGSKDIVGVGSDTLQNMVNFLLDGDYQSDSGFQTNPNKYRVFSFDATPDANDRAGYLTGATTGTATTNCGTTLAAGGKCLFPTIVLRGESSPVRRPNGSSEGIAALLADRCTAPGDAAVSGIKACSTSEQINFVRASRRVKVAEETSANGSATSGDDFGGIRQQQIATESVKVAVNAVAPSTPAGAAATCAPAGLSAFDLYEIYTGVWTTWSQIPGYVAPTGCSASSTIFALLPQDGSGTQGVFTTDLATAAGGSETSANVLKEYNTKIANTPTSGQKVEENDPSSITGLGANAVNAIAPFSESRKNLYDGIVPAYTDSAGNTNAAQTNPNGYFNEPDIKFGAAPVHLASNINLLNGASPDTAQGGTVTSTASYNDNRGLFIDFRSEDYTSTVKFEPGSSLNWVNTLFDAQPGGPTPYACSPANQVLIAEAGATPGCDDSAGTTGMG